MNDIATINLEKTHADISQLAYVTTVGDKAEKMLRHISMECSKDIAGNLLTLKESVGSIEYLIILTDKNDEALEVEKDLKRRYNYRWATILDISSAPDSTYWQDQEYYLWVPLRCQYTTVRDFIILFYETVIMHGLITFDLTDWRECIKGHNTLAIYKHILHPSWYSSLGRMWPARKMDGSSKYATLVMDKNLCVRQESSRSHKLMHRINDMFERLGEKALVKWQISAKFPRHGAIWLMQAKPLEAI